MLDWDECDYYHSNLANLLSGPWDSDFWRVTIMQLCHEEPAVRHAINAVSIAFRKLEASNLPISSVSSLNDLQVLRQCNIAMRTLSKRIAEDSESKLVPLIACLLFSCLEFMVGTVDSALIHVRSGLDILTFKTSDSVTDLSLNLGLQYIDEYITPIFVRLDLLNMMFAQDSSKLSPRARRRNQHPNNLSEARRIFFQLVNSACVFISTGQLKTLNSKLTDEDFKEQSAFQQEIRQWRDDLDNLVESGRLSGLPCNENAINMLHMLQRVISIWLSVCLYGTECSLDLHLLEFEEIVDIGLKIVSQNRNTCNPGLASFSFEMQLIAPLYFTAISCRDRLIRRRAVDLLFQTPQREGLWDAQTAIKLANCIIEIEEEKLEKDTSTATWGSSLPCENDRISYVQQMPGNFFSTPDVTMSNQAGEVFQITLKGATGEWLKVDPVLST
jgi:hypothetical protein